jgi:hypothetical protein
MKLDELDHNTLTIIQSMLMPNDSANLHLVSKTIHENLGEKYVVYERKEKKDRYVKFYNITKRKDLYAINAEITDKFLDELEEIFGSYKIYPHPADQVLIKFDKDVDIKYLKALVNTNVQKFYKLSAGLARSPNPQENIFYGKMIKKDDGKFVFPTIATGNKPYDLNINSLKFKFNSQTLKIKKLLDKQGNYTRYLTQKINNSNFIKYDEFYYLLIKRSIETKLLLFNKKIRITMNVDVIDEQAIAMKCNVGLPVNNINKILIINTENDNETTPISSIRIIFIFDNNELDIYTTNERSRVSLENNRFIIDKKLFSYKVILDVLNEKVYINSNMPHGDFSMSPEWDKQIKIKSIFT